MTTTNEILPSDARDNEDIHQRLRRHNRLFMRDIVDYSFHIEENGAIVAGIVAAGTMDTLEIEFLFVDEAHRGRGLGGKLLRYVEDRARAAGLKRALLNTYSFQAPDFYLKKGYARLFRIDPCFGEYSQDYYMKTL